jgi:hypothetical protein
LLLLFVALLRRQATAPHAAAAAFDAAGAALFGAA